MTPSTPSYDEACVRELFNRMGRSYDVVNFISSFGFSRWWRRQCVNLAQVTRGDCVCDLMAGGGECWPDLLQRDVSLVSIDFSPVMVGRQRRLRERLRTEVDVRCENALATSLSAASMDAVVCVFGLKTLASEARGAAAREVFRILRPGGRFAFLEISCARAWWAGPLYRWYISSIIPLIGRLCLGDIDCYRMLGAYTQAFGSCEHVRPAFREAGLSVELREHFHGCATSLAGHKPVA